MRSAPFRRESMMNYSAAKSISLLRSSFLVTGRHGVLQTGRAVVEHRPFVAPDAPVGQGLLVGGKGRRPLGTEEQALDAGNLIAGRQDISVRHLDGKAAAVPHRLEDQEIADGHGHANAGGNGPGSCQSSAWTSPAS